MSEFITIEKNVESQIVEKKSKFIANLIRVNNQEEAEKKIKEIRKKYYDARHHCVAYRVYELDRLIEKLSDDGEPSGTAGGPMLNILRNQNIGNVLIVVTRYFGGILLGTGGLVRAYSEATIKAIEIAQKVQRVMGIELMTILEYSQYENFKYYCQKNSISITNVEYAENIVCTITLEEEIKKRLIEDFETKKLILKDIKILSKKIINKSI